MGRFQRYVVVSSNANPNYLFYAKYIEYAWNSLGWGVCIMVTADVDHRDLKLNSFFQPSNKPPTIVITLPDIKELRKETIAQAGRLYAANYFHHTETLLMTSDMDLLPLSNYWNPDEDKITVYGHDLTDYSYIPMGYVAMSVGKWRDVMMATLDTEADMIRDSKEPFLKNNPYSQEWESWWGFDWDLLTNRLASYKKEISFIKRGRREDGSGFAYGRIDRGDSMKIIPKPWVDSHCENNNVMHPDKLNKFLSIFEEVYGKL